MSTMSPELALVDPELRSYAVDLLPRVRPYAFLELPPVPVGVPVRSETPEFRVSAAFAYLLVAVMRMAAFDAVVFASVAACVLIANLFG